VAYSTGTIILSKPSEGEVDAQNGVIDVSDMSLDTERMIKRVPGNDSIVLCVRSRAGCPIKIKCEWNR